MPGGPRVSMEVLERRKIYKLSACRMGKSRDFIGDHPRVATTATSSVKRSVPEICCTSQWTYHRICRSAVRSAVFLTVPYVTIHHGWGNLPLSLSRQGWILPSAWYKVSSLVLIVKSVFSAPFWLIIHGPFLWFRLTILSFLLAWLIIHPSFWSTI